MKRLSKASLLGELPRCKREFPRTFGRGSRTEKLMNKLSLKMKLAVGLGSPLAILVALGIVAYNSVGQLGELAHRVEEVTANRDRSSRIETAVEKQTTGVRGFLLAGNEDRLKHDEEGKQEFTDNLDKLAQKLDTEEGKKLHAKIGHA